MNDQDPFRLDGKVALVTGASRGIGAAIALALADAGADIGLVAQSREPNSARLPIGSAPDNGQRQTGRGVRAGAGDDHEFTFAQLVKAGNKVIVASELRRADGSGGRITGVLTFDEHDEIMGTEVYFDWSV